MQDLTPAGRTTQSIASGVMTPLHHSIFCVIVAIAAQNASAQQITPSVTPETGLTKEIQEAKRLAPALRASADKFDKEFWIGTMFNDVDRVEHTCYSLGMLLGLSANIRHLRFDRSLRVARTSDEAHNLRVKAQSLDNFVSAADASLKESNDKRGITWNLDCSEKYGVGVQQKGDSTFYEVTNGGRGIKILGGIEAGFTAKLRSTLERAPNAEFIALGSGGGSVAEAIASGRLIRSRGLATTIWNNCYSACPLVFLGGVKRHVHSPYPSFGFHQISTSAGAIPTSSPIYAHVADYTREMGASDQFVLGAMLRATPAQMHMVNGADVQLCRARVATWIQRACESDR